MEQITAEALRDRLKQNAALHVLDVREREEYEANNIGAVLLPLSQLRNMDAEEIEGWEDEEVVVHCKSGKRSLEACMILQTLGFSKTINLIGGIEAWQEKYPGHSIRDGQ